MYFTNINYNTKEFQAIAAQLLCERTNMYYCESVEDVNNASQTGHMFYARDARGTYFLGDANIYAPAFNGKTFKFTNGQKPWYGMQKPVGCYRHGMQYGAIINPEMTAMVWATRECFEKEDGTPNVWFDSVVARRFFYTDLETKETKVIEL